ncbi:MAG: hypothetical protein U0798_01895 [Gemmataceae bacterium]
MSVSTCPFCNAVLPAPAPTFCPRCDERLPGGVESTAAGFPSKPAAREASPKWFRIGFPLSCLVSIVLFFGGLYFVNRSKTNDAPPTSATTKKSGDSTAGPATVPPLNLAALAYLPANVQMIAAVQTAPIDHFARRSLVDGNGCCSMRDSPIDFRFGLAKSGVPYESIDHFAIGLTLLRG